MPLKDIISIQEFNKLTEKDRTTILNDYEFVSEHDYFKIKYIKKTIYYGNPNDIVTDPMCNLSFLEGATIRKVGFHKKAKEGGLAIVYELNGQEKVAVLGFTELGMWVYANTEVEKDNP